MKTPRLRIDWATPNDNLLRMLGVGLLAAASMHAAIAAPFLNDHAGYDLAEIFVIYLLILVNLANGILAASIAIESSRRPPSAPARLGATLKSARFVHFAVAVCAAIALPTFLAAAGEAWSPSDIFATASWTALAGGALVLALLSATIWNIRHAALGAVASISVFGCAVWYAPTIYGWDLRPLGWYAILSTALPVLAFLTLFLRRAPVFRRFHWLRFGTAAALFAALACAVGFHMAANPDDAFGESLQTALSARPNQIRFSELTNFEWDAVEIYGSYTYRESISPIALEGTDIVSRSYFGYNEIGDLAVFVKGGEVVYYELVWYDRHGFRFPPGSQNPVVLTPENAVFNAEHRDDGYRILILAE